jgi:RNA polymerase Rpb2, domain 2
VYNLEGGEAGEVDAQMVEALRPSIEEAEPIGTQEMALDYIGKRGAQVAVCC